MKSPGARICQLPNRPSPTAEAADHLSLRVRELQSDRVVEMTTTTIWGDYVGYRDLRAEMALAQRAYEGVYCAREDASTLPFTLPESGFGQS